VGEGAAAAEAEQRAPVEESQPPAEAEEKEAEEEEEEEEEREECAICLQDLELARGRGGCLARRRWRGGGACDVAVRASLPQYLWGHVVRQVRGQGLRCDMS
jgi:hypothetical protein